jgi:TPR repeat protein
VATREDDERERLELAANEGDPAAMCSLAFLLEDIDADEARHWYERASELGNLDAMFTSPFA